MFNFRDRDFSFKSLKVIESHQPICFTFVSNQLCFYNYVSISVRFQVRDWKISKLSGPRPNETMNCGSCQDQDSTRPLDIEVFEETHRDSAKVVKIETFRESLIH